MFHILKSSQLLFLFSFISFSHSLASEKLNASLNLDSCDNIILRNGEEISCKVIEVGVTEIKYNKCPKSGGPIYSILKDDVFMIQYSNGSKDIIPKEKGVGKKEEASNIKREEAKVVFKLDEVDEKPEFTGGLDYLPTFISLNLNYGVARKYKMVGSTVNVSFIVDEQSNVIEPRVIKSAHPAVDEEALRVIKNLKFKNPAYKDFKPVSVEISLEITFSP